MDLDEEIKSREEGEIGLESREKGDLLPCSSPLSLSKHPHEQHSASHCQRDLINSRICIPSFYFMFMFSFSGNTSDKG